MSGVLERSMGCGRGSLARSLGAVLALLAALALWQGAERAEAACDADVCLAMEFQTDQEGVYHLVITPWMTAAMLPEPLRDCVWEVEATFSDGSPPEYHVFDAASGFASSHRFPAPGEHAVVVLATNGVQADNGEPCPSIQIDAKVTYPEPPPPPPPPPDPPQEEPPDPPPDAPPADPGAVVAPEPLGAALPYPPAAAPSGPGPGLRWLRCGATLSRGVACARAVAVIRAARSRLSQGSSRLRTGRQVRALGFLCRPRASGARLLCRRGELRVLGPLAPGRPA